MKYKIYSRIWIETEHGMFMGEGRYKLLKAIANTGSLSKAAKTLNMSYKKAWRLVSEVNSAGESSLTLTSTGGKGGGGTTLTEYGIKAVTAYETMKKECWEYLSNQERNLMQ